MANPTWKLYHGRVYHGQREDGERKQADSCAQVPLVHSCCQKTVRGMDGTSSQFVPVNMSTRRLNTSISRPSATGDVWYMYWEIWDTDDGGSDLTGGF
jgi:hypothetical protein